MPRATRICLFNPINVPTYPPLNLTYLASYLRKYGRFEYEIVLVDINCDHVPLQKIISSNPDIVGFTSLSSHIVEIYEMSKELRKRRDNIVQICGGPHAAIKPKEILTKGDFDIVVIGEGEATFVEFVDAFIENGGRLKSDYLLSIKGIAFKDEGTIRINPQRETITDIDDIPHPSRGLLNNKFYCKRYYAIRGINSSRVYTIATSRGCPFKCIFCCVNFVTKSKVRFHSAEYVIEEMEELVGKYNAKWLFFTDDTFLVNKDRTRKLAKEIIRNGLHRKVKWEVQIRSDLIGENDLPLLKLLKDAGCDQIDYGFESGNQRVLSLIKGGSISIEDHQRAIDLTNEAGINVMGTFILATPTETYDEMLDTKAFILKNYKKLHAFQVGCLIPYPGTRAYELCVEKGVISNNYFEELENQKKQGIEQGMRVFSDIVPASKVLQLRRELDTLSFKKIALQEKFGWLVYNALNNPRTAVQGVRWALKRLFGVV